jgi:ribonucleotide reductase beta subunit family protein with ferritin-like domain
MEDCLVENEHRYCLYPIKHDDLWRWYKKQCGCFWTAEEIDFKGDKDDWLKLKPEEQHFIKMVLAFFASADGIVMDNLGTRFLSEVKWAELTFCYSVQIFIECIHAETYSLLIDTYIEDEDEKRKLFNAIDNYPCVERKQRWAIKWIQDEKSSFATRLIAFAICEGIFFSSSFCAIYWLKERGIMKGLCFSNSLIARDEGLHTDLAVLVYNKLKNKLSQEEVVKMFKGAVEIEKQFTTDAIPCRMIGMNSKLMCEYIEFVADRLIVQLGYKPIYGKKKCVFDFMEKISIEGKSNFFEIRVGEYAVDMNVRDDSVFNMDSVF